MAQSPLEYVVAHWSKLIENFSTSSDEFYKAVDEALERRQLHEARSRYIDWSEGGVLSPNREYFRVEGCGFSFDLCAAPLREGSGWLTGRDRGERPIPRGPGSRVA